MLIAAKEFCWLEPVRKHLCLIQRERKANLTYEK